MGASVARLVQCVPHTVVLQLQISSWGSLLYVTPPSLPMSPLRNSSAKDVPLAPSVPTFLLWEMSVFLVGCKVVLSLCCSKRSSMTQVRRMETAQAET